MGEGDSQKGPSHGHAMYIGSPRADVDGTSPPSRLFSNYVSCISLRRSNISAEEHVGCMEHAEHPLQDAQECRHREPKARNSLKISETRHRNREIAPLWRHYCRLSLTSQLITLIYIAPTLGIAPYSSTYGSACYRTQSLHSEPL